MNNKHSQSNDTCINFLDIIEHFVPDASSDVSTPILKIFKFQKWLIKFVYIYSMIFDDAKYVSIHYKTIT